MLQVPLREHLTVVSTHVKRSRGLIREDERLEDLKQLGRLCGSEPPVVHPFVDGPCRRSCGSILSEADLVLAEVAVKVALVRLRERCQKRAVGRVALVGARLARRGELGLGGRVRGRQDVVGQGRVESPSL
jgi:hypothetical protein